MSDEKQLFCEKCKKVMKAEDFYCSNNLEKYPTGRLSQCKKCITMHVDNWDPSTYVWILEECDVPYVPDVWNSLLSKYGRDKRNVTGTTILGRYLSQMKMKQWKDYRWADTEFLQELANQKIEQAMKRQGFSAAEITKTLEEGKVVIPEKAEIPDDIEEPQEMYDNEDYFAQQNNYEYEDDLTEEDKIYLTIKWGKIYRPEEWVKLEDMYERMSKSYDIQGAAHEDNLKLVCKTSLKLHQLLDIGDVDGAQKMQKMYDSLMKSGNFTAAQNKQDKGEFVDAIAQLVEICEREGYIERYYVEKPKDRVDETIFDLKDYTKSLVTEEMNLGNLIESAVKAMMEEENKEEDEDIDEEELSLEAVEFLTDEDFEDFNEFKEQDALEDEE